MTPHDAEAVAARLRDHEILIKPLNDPRLGPGYMRVTTALPEDNRRFLSAIRAVFDGKSCGTRCLIESEDL